jgi:hypothetical protein
MLNSDFQKLLTMNQGTKENGKLELSSNTAEALVFGTMVVLMWAIGRIIWLMGMED